ncbi:MAG: hypothetical protein KF791_20540 [Verrucomicrobiae bacterium]|nr:hypothetical protein [Verrucomicrobiae bacterium]
MQIANFFYGGAMTNLVITNGFSASSNAPPARPVPRFDIHRWSKESGLPGNKILSLLQTRDGYLWIGNVTALVRFDGVRFTTFDPANTPEMEGYRFIGRCLHEDNEGRLWIGAENGLLCRADGRFVSFPGQAELRSEKLNAITRRAAGGFWIGADRGLGWWDGGGVRWMEVPDVNRVLSLAESRHGSLWIGTSGALVAFDPLTHQVTQVLTRVELGSRSTSLDIYGLLFDRRQRLWIGSNHGVARLDRPDAIPRRVKLWVHNPHARLAEDLQGNVWATNESETGQHQGGLMRLADGEDGIVATPVGPMLGSMRHVLVDQEGAVWAGGRDGLVRLRSPPLTSMSFDGIGDTELHSLVADETGVLWLGGNYYFGRWSGNELSILDTQHLFNARTRPLQHPLVTTDAFGQVWAGHSYGGFFQLPSSRFEHATEHPFVRHFQELGQVQVLQASRLGGLWLGTTNGLYRATSPTTLERVTDVAFPELHALAEDRRTNLWIATAGGLFQLDAAGLLRRIADPSEGSRTAFIALHAGGEGDLWLGTPHGLCRFANDEFAIFGPESGLPQQPIHGILEDDSRRLWMSDDAGLVRVAQDELELWLRDRTRRPAVARFGPADGVLVLKSRSGSQSSVKGSDGRLWFARGSSLVVVDPAQCPTAPPPSVFIECVIANGGTWDMATMPSTPSRRFSEPPSASNQAGGDSSLPGLDAMRRVPPPTLSPRQGQHLEFHFTATSLHSPERVRVRYKLEGHDPDWREAGSVRRASYTKVQPGHYQFRVQARSHEGRWSQRDAVLAFRLAPYFWQTWPFHLGSLFAVTGAAGGFAALHLRRQRHRSEARRLMSLQRERERIARDMHDNLGAHLTELAFTVSHRSEAGKQVRASLDELHDAVWAVNPNNDSSAELAGFIANHSRRCLSAVGLAAELDLPPASPQIAVPGVVRHEVAAMFKEAIRNVIQHAHARSVKIRLRADERELSLCIQDDGGGFRITPGAGAEPSVARDVAVPSMRGNGLRNFHTRCEQLGGCCRIDSVPGRGTRVEFSVPLHNETFVKQGRWFRRGRTAKPGTSQAHGWGRYPADHHP